MKILFASDMSFAYFKAFTSKNAASEAFAEIAPIFKNADFSIINLESVFGKDGKTYTPIKKSGVGLISDPRFISYVDALSPTVIGLANNHTMDFDGDAMFDTIDLLKSKGYKVIGAGKNADEAYEGAIIEKDKIKCRIIAICENEFGTTDGDQPGTAGYSLKRVSAAIKRAAAKNELPIIYFHGGNEFYPFPSPKRAEIFRHFIDLGAKAVISMHTHCPQGYEIYNGCPIVYSMGNFFFPEGADNDWTCPAWDTGYTVLMNIDKNGISMETIPYKQTFDGIALIKNEEKKRFEKYLEYISSAIKDEKKIKEYFDSWCMIMGIEYSRFLGFDADRVDEYTAEDVMAIRNNFKCEAHNELLTNTLNVIYEERVKEAKAGVDFIKRLQRLELE